MKLVKLALGAGLLVSTAAAQATTVVIIVEPMTLQHLPR